MNGMPQATPPTALALADWSILSAQQFRQPNLMLYLTYFLCVTVVTIHRIRLNGVPYGLLKNATSKGPLIRFSKHAAS